MKLDYKSETQTGRGEIIKSYSKIFTKPTIVLIFVTVSIFFAESAVMLILSYLPPLSVVSEALIDSLMLIILILPLLYLFLLRPLKIHIVERTRLENKLKEEAITDELTGLLNRRGFSILAEQQCKIAIRNKDGISLIFADIDNMKYINDKFGHSKGDEALINIANIMKKTFRESDIIGRIGGDEFAILITTNLDQHNENIISSKFQENLKNYNKQNQHNYELSVSIGIAHDDMKSPCSLENLLHEADKLMYKQKRQRSNSALNKNR